MSDLPTCEQGEGGPLDVRSDISALGLDELSERANATHLEVLRLGEALLERAVYVGDLLNEARRRLRRGEWGEWLDQNFVGTRQTASNYRLLSSHAEYLRASGCTNITSALSRLRRDGVSALPPISEADQKMRDEAKRLAAEGHGSREIARRMGMSYSTVWSWIRESRRGRRPSPAERRLARQRRIDTAIRVKGGDLSSAYSLARRTAQSLDRAIAAEQDDSARAALKVALSRLYTVEDQIVRASGVSRKELRS